MSPILTTRRQLLPGRFVRLMDLYEDNHARLERLFAPASGAGPLPFQRW